MTDPVTRVINVDEEEESAGDVQEVPEQQLVYEKLVEQTTVKAAGALNSQLDDDGGGDDEEEEDEDDMPDLKGGKDIILRKWWEIRIHDGQSRHQRGFRSNPNDLRSVFMRVNKKVAKC